MKVASPIILVSALLACSTQAAAQARALPPNCSADAPCQVTVIVPGNCGSGIHVSPDPIVITDRRPVTIVWKVTGGWEFARDGIAFRGVGYERAFGDAKLGGSTYTVTHRNQGPAVYKYDVNLTKGTQTCSLDPTVVNQ